MSETQSAPRKRPLSPHLQVYKLPMTALMSISHRMTGVALSLGLILVTAFLFAAALGEESFEAVSALMRSLPGKIILFAWSLALYYHMCNGVRHLIWDTVHLLELGHARTAGFIVLAAAVILTALTWYFASL